MPFGPDYDYDDPDEERGAYERGDYDSVFADPGSGSALRAATHGRCPGCKKHTGKTANYCRHCGMAQNPRNLPCPRCKVRNRLTPADRARGYVCDPCADRAERGQMWPEGY